MWELPQAGVSMAEQSQGRDQENWVWIVMLLHYKDDSEDNNFNYYKPVFFSL